MVKVKEYMTKNVDVVNPNNTVGEVIDLIKRTTHDTFPVIDNNKLVGIISVHDIFGVEKSERIETLMTKREKMIITRPDAPVRDVGRIMFRTGFSKLPVVNNNNELVGIITNTDVIRSQIEKTTPSKLNKIVKTYESLGYKIRVDEEIIPIDKLKPTQSKIYADELCGREYELKMGLAEPIIVIKTKATGDKYILLDGHHRAVACHLSNIPTLNAHVIIVDTNNKLGIEKTAEKQGLKSLKDVKIIDEDKNDSSDIYELDSKLEHQR